MAKWACGLTTVLIRRGDLLPKTLAAIANAGFPPPRLFLDGATPRAELGYRHEFVGLQTSAHYPALGVVGNWWAGLLELFVREPAADWYAIFQDDILLCKNVRGYVERCGFPQNHWLNLVTHPAAKDLLAPLAAGGGGANPEWFVTRQLYASKPGPAGVPMQKGAGACALCLPRIAVAALLSSQGPVSKVSGAYPLTGLDGMIVDTLNRLGFQEVAHNPTLGIHTGAVSTLPGSRPQRVSQGFLGIEFDALSWG